MTCDHDWQPHPTANARYRCTKCFAIGYKPKARGDQHFRQVDAHGIRPYACVTCGGPATAHEPNSKGTNIAWRCSAHRT